MLEEGVNQRRVCEKNSEAEDLRESIGDRQELVVFTTQIGHREPEGQTYEGERYDHQALTECCQIGGKQK